MAGPFRSVGRNTATSAGDAGGAGDSRRKLLIAGAAGLAVLVAAILLLPALLGGGDSDDSTVATPKRKPVPSASASQAPANAEPQFVLAPVAAYGDPFEPLPEEAAAAAAAAAATAPAVAGTGTTTDPAAAGTSTPTDPAAVTDPAAGTTTTGTTGTGTPADGSGAAAQTVPGKPVQVMAISASTADIEIDSKPYKVQTGSTPVAGYSVTAIGGGKVTITHNGVSRSMVAGELQTF